MKHQQVAGGQQVAEPVEPLSFDQVLSLEALEVAGRSVNVRKELGTQLRGMFEGDARELVRSYQGCSSTTLVAVHAHAAVLQAAHALLASYLPLPTWAQLWAQADRPQPGQEPLYPSVPPMSGDWGAGKPAFTHSHGSQVAAHTIRQVLGEVLESYSYQSHLQRFVPAEQAGGPQQLRTELYVMAPRAQSGYGLNFTSVMTRAAGYFGAEHLQALLQMGGEAAVAKLLQQLTDKINQLLQVRGASWGGVPRCSCHGSCAGTFPPPASAPPAPAH